MIRINNTNCYAYNEGMFVYPVAICETFFIFIFRVLQANQAAEKKNSNDYANKDSGLEAQYKKRRSYWHTKREGREGEKKETYQPFSLAGVENGFLITKYILRFSSFYYFVLCLYIAHLSTIICCNDAQCKVST